VNAVDDKDTDSFFRALAGMERGPSGSSLHRFAHTLRRRLIERRNLAEAEPLTADEVARREALFDKLASEGYFRKPAQGADRSRRTLDQRGDAGWLERTIAWLSRWQWRSPLMMGTATAALAGVLTIGLLLESGERDGDAMRGAASLQVVVPDPTRTADELGARLKRVGAEVTVVPIDADSVAIEIRIDEAGKRPLIAAELSKLGVPMPPGTRFTLQVRRKP